MKSTRSPVSSYTYCAIHRRANLSRFQATLLAGQAPDLEVVQCSENRAHWHVNTT